MIAIMPAFYIFKKDDKTHAVKRGSNFTLCKKQTVGGEWKNAVLWFQQLSCETCRAAYLSSKRSVAESRG